MTAIKKFDLPDDAFDHVEEKTPTPSPEMAKFLKRKINEETGKLEKKRPRPRTIAASVFNNTKVAVSRMLETGNWEGATPRHLVALFDIMHERVYGIENVMSPSERYTYTLRMGGFVKNHFAGDIEEAINYFHWAWTREAGREKWRRDNAQEGGHLSLGFLMTGRCLTQWRVDMSRIKR